MGCSENALKVLQSRYLTKDENGKVLEEPKDLLKRVAKVVAAVDFEYGASGEESAKEFYRIMANMEFLPNSPTLMNAGRKLGQLSACFVLPVGDSIEDIFEAVKNTAIIHQTGGGTGFSFSRLRPSNDVVKTTMGKSSGPLSFMKVFNQATEQIKQGGTRRGANMAILRVDHPDIIQFIECKRDLNELTNFNISVALTDKFMEALENDDEYDLINPRNQEVWGRLRAKEVFDKVVDNAWFHGDPGIVFIDRINKYAPVPSMGPIEATNPCGEQPLEPYGSCNLGSINLAKMVAEKNGDFQVDYEKLRKTVRIAVRFLDNVIDANKYPLKQIEEVNKKLRRIGLGVMGFSDMLIKLGVPYDSNEAVRLAEDLMNFINTEAWNMSRELGEKRGSFLAFSDSTLVAKGEKAVRNCSITTIAPTGTISIISNCSSGIEPLFAISYIRENILGGDTKLVEVNPLFEKIAKQRGFYSEELMKKIAQKGSLQEIMEIPEDVRRVFVTSHDISPEWHVKIQAAFQKYVDNAVSKTVNFKHDATREDVYKVYMLAYDLGCKGVTIYRDGCRDKQVLNIAGTKDLQKKNGNELEQLVNAPVTLIPKKRPQVLEGKTIKIGTGEGDLYVTINQDEEGIPFELFATMGKSGGFSAAQTEAIGRLISLCFRSNIEPLRIIKQLKGIRGSKPIGFGENRVLSSPDAIAKALEIYLRPPLDLEFDKEDHVKLPIVTDEDVVKDTQYQICSECGGTVEHEGGCSVCHDCGYSECG
ncbi:MAG: vitamin B12-dependent ribonucleotide reductase [Patescibacteria group bacterium]